MTNLNDADKPSQLDQYFSEASTFNQDTYYAAIQRERRWQTVALLSSLSTVAVLGLLFYLFPLKEYKPLYLVKDPVTDQYKPLPLQKKPMIITVTDATRAYWINQFLIARESWNPTVAVDRQELVVALSSKRVVAHFNAEQAEMSTDSFKHRFAYHTMRQVEVIGLTHLNENTTTVRFKVKHISNGSIKTFLYQGVVSYIWNPTLMKNDKDKLLNPVGFVVTSYDISLELPYQKEQSK